MSEYKYRKCSKCGSYANANSKYCRICGSKLSPKKEEDNIIIKIREKNKLITLVICIAMVSLVILGIMLFIHR